MRHPTRFVEDSSGGTAGARKLDDLLARLLTESSSRPCPQTRNRELISAAFVSIISRE